MVEENVIVAQTHLDLYSNKSNDAKILNRIRYVNCMLALRSVDFKLKYNMLYYLFKYSIKVR